MQTLNWIVLAALGLVALALALSGAVDPTSARARARRHEAALSAAEAALAAGDASAAVVCERPKLAPHRDEMQERLSAAAGAPVTVTGRRAEGLGAIGRMEGIACWASVVITR